MSDQTQRTIEKDLIKGYEKIIDDLTLEMEENKNSMDCALQLSEDRGVFIEKLNALKMGGMRALKDYEEVVKKKARL